MKSYEVFKGTTSHVLLIIWMILFEFTHFVIIPVALKALYLDVCKLISAGNFTAHALSLLFFTKSNNG